MKLRNVLILAVVTAVLASCGGGGMNMGNNEYPVETIGSQSATLQTTYPASIRGVQDVEIRPKVSGFITEMRVEQGQAVKAGQVLFVIDNSTYQAAVRQAQASLNSAKAQLNTAKLSYENSKKLFERNVIGQYELETAQNAYETAKAAVGQAEAVLSTAKDNLGFCFVKSPTNGVVGSLPYRVGSFVSSASAEALTTVSNAGSIEVFFSVTEKDILDLTKKDGGINTAIKDYPAVKLQLADGTIYEEEGKVVKVSGVIDPMTGSVSMIARFPNAKHLLKSGASGTIIVPKDLPSAIVVPQNATISVQDKLFVYVLGANNKVKYTEITVESQSDGVNYIVTSGLKVGDKIVVKGVTTLADGMEIKPITPEQYQKNLDEAAKMAETQESASDFVDAMKK